MTPTPEVKPLPHLQRRIVFICSLIIFFITVPLLVFYAIGYRFDFSGEVTNIKSVGGIYVTSEVREVEMYIDDEPVEDMRIFQNAAYIQNLESAVHQIHTQGEGLQTWVKDLPVFSHFVTEVQSFNMPAVPQLRVVSEYKTILGADVLFGEATTTKFAFASTTNTFFQATSTATTTFEQNPEFVYIQTLFASSTEERLLLKQQKDLIEANRFTFGSAATASAVSATTTKEYGDTRLYKVDEEVLIQWTGVVDDIPYYYCIRSEGATSTASLYGEHVSTSLQAQLVSASKIGIQTDTERTDHRHCRTIIAIDRLHSVVIDFDYFPNSRDLILMQLQDGVYVVEVDDRSWQNTQLLYPGDYLQLVIDGGRIFIKDDDYYVEVFTELQ